MNCLGHVAHERPLRAKNSYSTTDRGSAFAYQSATDSISAEIASVNENHVHLGPKPLRFKQFFVVKL